MNKDFIPGLVSVVIPTYNREDSILDAIQSVVEQDYKNIEILVCDDFSQDDTKTVVLNYAKEHDNVKYLLRSDGGKGAQWARNNGIECARGEYIAFLDSDDELLPGSISNRVAAFHDHPTVDMVYGDVDVDHQLFHYDHIQYEDQNLYLMQELSLCCFITIMVRKKAFEKMPLLDTELKSWQDDNLVLNINKYGMKMFHCGVSVANIRRVGDSISTNSWNLFYGLKRLIKIYRNDIVDGSSYCRLLLWKLRILNNWFLAMRNQQRYRLNRVIFSIAHKITYIICRMFFRHIWG
ncbi:glycosyltransferase family 2 protein [Anaerovibrio sp. RM50]|uniref:glycosyltransferase family 2 protein n=1 Tax=Anaerovibrio sp. RM50 TaxID=1200557 RepID=UPI000907B3B9|nr:glycosyltransferase family 2 protein [Anaerovibrio sp. RM50]